MPPATPPASSANRAAQSSNRPSWKILLEGTENGSIDLLRMIEIDAA
jgi:hypothetical protein